MAQFIVDAQVPEDLTQLILQGAFMTNQISLINNIKAVASGTVSFGKLSLYL